MADKDATFDFLALPRELRDMVYCIIAPAATIAHCHATAHQTFSDRRVNSLLLVNHQISMEYIEYCTTRMHALFHIADTFTNGGWHTSEGMRQGLRRATISVEIDNPWGTSFFSLRGNTFFEALKTLLSGFTNLRELDLVMNFHPGSSASFLTVGSWTLGFGVRNLFIGVGYPWEYLIEATQMLIMMVAHKAGDLHKMVMMTDYCDVVFGGEFPKTVTLVELDSIGKWQVCKWGQYSAGCKIPGPFRRVRTTPADRDFDIGINLKVLRDKHLKEVGEYAISLNDQWDQFVDLDRPSSPPTYTPPTSPPR